MGCDLTDPTVVVPSIRKTVIPEPEKHFPFSTTLMVMAIELYQRESEQQFCHYVTYAHRKLVQFVESRKQMTAESYRFFVENAYNQFFQHESFHTSARSKTKAKDVGASGILHTSTKLSGYVWVGSETKLAYVPEDKAGDVQMDADDDEAVGELDEFLKLSVKVQKDGDDEVYEEVPDEPMEGVGSQEREETREQTGHSEETEKPALPPAHNAMQKLHHVPIFSAKDYVKIRQWIFNLGNILSAADREGRRLPTTPGEADTLGMVWFVEFMSTEAHSDFMKAYPNMTFTDLDPDEFHDMQVKCKRVMEENEHIHISTIEEEENPELREDPRNKKKIEHMTPENKQLILEIDNSALVDCTVQWLMMLNKDLQEKIVQRISTVIKKEDVDDQDADDEDDQDISKEPVVPPAKMVSIETQTGFPEQSEQPGSSHQREEPASSVGSQQRERKQKRRRKTSVLMILLL